MSHAECLVLLVGDDPPQDPQAEQEVENLLYTDRDLSDTCRRQCDHNGLFTRERMNEMAFSTRVPLAA